ncbi:hypothetical protein [Streptomyces sp. NPDC013489]|uniref:hypothetical protein n=1 Tax=Streptomyces sp. NPDC013489 TaxID=3155606 RepID=UPI0033E85800
MNNGALRRRRTGVQWRDLVRAMDKLKSQWPFDGSRQVIKAMPRAQTSCSEGAVVGLTEAESPSPFRSRLPASADRGIRLRWIRRMR